MSLDKARDTRNREAMEAFHLDALVCRLPENVLVLTGYWPLSSSAFAVVARDGLSALIVMDTEEELVPHGAADRVSVMSTSMGSPGLYELIQRSLWDIFRAHGLERARVGYEGNFEAIAPGHGAGEVFVPAAGTLDCIRGAAPEAVLVDGTVALEFARAVKTPREIEALRRANRVAAFGLEAFRALYEPGRTEAEIAAATEAAIMRHGIGYEGSGTARGWAHLMSGPAGARAYSLHPRSSSRVVERGDLGVLELATVVDGFWADLTRTLVAGSEPDERQSEMWDAILAARQNVLQRARSGMTGAEIDRLARSAIEDRGLGRHFVHQTGHGLGFRYHEPIPLLHPDNEKAIQPGMVSSVEPGLYVGGWGGMRLEENVVFTSEGVELLSTFDTSL
jgi:Xaa-Pro aminopeptidase